MDNERHRVTSAEVARACGVSRATVSYVLNNDPRQHISPETREKVLETARQLKYQPFAPARVLRSGYSQLVLAVLPFEQVDPLIASSLQKLQDALAENGFSLIWHVGLHDLEGQTHPSANLAPAAIVSYVDEDSPAANAFISQFNVPTFSLLSPSSRESVGRTQAEYLARRGFHRLVYAAPERSDLQSLSQGRLAGVRRACAELGLAPPQVQTIPATRSAAREALTGLLARQPLPFGLCCYNDEVAIAAMAALTDVGVQIPAQVAVIGCDDIPLAQFSIPPLTTVNFDNPVSLEELAEQIIAASQGETAWEVPPTTLSITVRGSA